MKYYYILHDGPFRNNLILGKDLERIIRDKNKIIISRINGSFHVLVCRNGIFEKEKKVLSYFELVNFLKRNTFNAYFINVNGETAYYIHSYVKKDDGYKDNIVMDEKSKPIFTIIGDELLKIDVSINREVIKEKIITIYNNEIVDDSNFQNINLVDFIENSELFEIYHLPFNEKNGKFMIPNYSYSNPSLFYILSGIYSKPGNKINLSGADLLNLNVARIMDERIANDIINSIEFNIEDLYKLEDFSKSIDFIDLYIKQQNDISIKLKLMKKRLEEAKKNQMIIDDLGLSTKIVEKNNVLLKKGVKNE